MQHCPSDAELPPTTLEYQGSILVYHCSDGKLLRRTLPVCPACRDLPMGIVEEPDDNIGQSVRIAGRRKQFAIPRISERAPTS